MTSSKSLASGVAATALVAAIGFAYAQTATPPATQAQQGLPTPATTGTPTTPMQTPAAPSTTVTPSTQAAPMTPPATATTPAPTQGTPGGPTSTDPMSAAPVERAPQADRN